MSEIDLLPCPFCGKPGELVKMDGARAHRIGARCSDSYCGAITRLAYSDIEAVALWNTRLNQAATGDAGSCELCAGKCRGHRLGHPEDWEPEQGSRDALLTEITTLRARIAEAEEVIRPFAEHPAFHASDDWPVTFADAASREPGVTAGHFRKASLWLGGKG